MKLSAHARLAVPLLIGMLISISLLGLSELSHRRLNAANQALASSMETQALATELLGLVTDAETAQRGFLLTEQSGYLDPYLAAVPRIGGKLDALARLVRDNPEQSARIARLRELIPAKLTELDAALNLYHSRGPQAARELLIANRGRAIMEEIRQQIDAMTNSERAALVQLSYRWNQDVASSRFGLAMVTALNVILLIVVYILASRELAHRERMRLRLVEQKRILEDQVRSRTAELSELSSELQRVQEVERSRLARELHDEMGSILISAKMDLSWAFTRIRESHPEAAAKLTRALAMLDDGVGVKRRIVDDLRPALLDNLGLGAAITWHVEQMSERGGLKCDVRVPEDDSPLPGHIAIALFRVVQESLTNVVRHAKAARTWIELQRDGDEVKLEIRDDGIGLPRTAARGHRAHGIVSMRQRILGVGGEFEIRRTHPQGTGVYVRVPLAATMPVDQRADQSQGVD